MFSWYYCLFPVCLFAVSANVVRNNDLYRLDIVHYNDFHDRFEETSVIYPICKSNDTTCIGGFARLYQEINTLLQEKPGALLLDAGDTFQGTFWYTLLKWNVTQTFINMLPNDAHALGNHEFDDGPSGLIPYIKALKGPVLAANLVSSNESGLQGLYQPHVVVEKKGRKIGIIGLITKRTELLSNAEGVTFLEPIPVVQREAQLLTDQGVDIIVVLSHCGLDVDKEMAKQVGENIDIIVGGHTHSLLWNGEAPSKEVVEGPYPLLVESDANPAHKVVIVTASAFTKYLGNMTAFFDSQGELQSVEGAPVFLNRSIPEDPKIKALLQPYKDRLHKVVNEVVGFANDDMSMEPCGSRECHLGNIMADAFLDASKKFNSSDLHSIALLQRCMIRSSISKGDITRGTIINMSPFSNNVVQFMIPGEALVKALEKSVTKPWTVKPYNGCYTPIVSGLKVNINTTSAKLIDISLKVGDEFKPFDVNQNYLVTTVDFLGKGGNGLTMFKEHARNMTIVGKDRDVVEAFISKISPITPYLDNRLTLVG